MTEHPKPCRFARHDQPRMLRSHTKDLRETMDEAAKCVNTPRPLTTQLDSTERGLAVKATRTCEAAGCESETKSPGLATCAKHYQRLRAHGSLHLPPRPEFVPNPCAVPECERPASSKGHCAMHAERVRRNGYTDALVVISDDELRFWIKVEKTETCWLWTAKISHDGYGKFSVNGKQKGAHRFAYQLIVGPIPEALVIDHLCRVRNCVNPSHMEVVTPEENTRRGHKARRA